MSIISDNLKNIFNEIETKLKEISDLSVTRALRNYKLINFYPNIDIIINSISRTPISLTEYQFRYEFSLYLANKWDTLKGDTTLDLLNNVIDKLDELRIENASILNYCTEVEIGTLDFTYQSEGNINITFVNIPLIVYS